METYTVDILPVLCIKLCLFYSIYILHDVYNSIAHTLNIILLHKYIKKKMFKMKLMKTHESNITTAQFLATTGNISNMELFLHIYGTCVCVKAKATFRLLTTSNGQ